MIKLLIITLLSLVYHNASAQLVTESFGSGVNAFTMDFVTIGNPNNAADTTGAPNPAGSVAYTYNLGKYEVSRDMINKVNSEANLGITMFDMSSYGGNGVNRPASGVSWFGSAKFVNYMNTSSGSTAAYKFDSSGNFIMWAPTDAGYNANNLFRNSNAKYFLPSTDEWFKAAYGSPSGLWFNFPTGSDAAPKSVIGGEEGNTAVYDLSLWAGPADITNAGGLSAYGTMAQGGNVFEHLETAADGINDTADENRKHRGDSWYGYFGLAERLDSSTEYSSPPSREDGANIGFRVAMVPEPSAVSLLAVGLGALAMMRRRRS